MSWVNTAIRLSEQGALSVLVTVAAAEGSSPREAGAKMLVYEGGFEGTIGGGGLELTVTEEARRMIADLSSPMCLVQEIPLGPNLGQCCGGNVSLVYERIDQSDAPWLAAWEQAEDGASHREFRTVLGGTSSEKRNNKVWADRPLEERKTLLANQNGELCLVETVFRQREKIWIFGAGHVGQAMIPVFSGLEFDVTVVDDRPEWLDKMDPTQATGLFSLVPEGEVAHIEPGACVLVLTHNHGLDFDICAAALHRDDLPFVGMIGSRSKRVQALRHFATNDVSDTALTRFVSPIGLSGLRDKRPAAIAVSVAAQLLQFFEELKNNNMVSDPQKARAGE